ncbi:MAG TPA: hypothetical protein PKW30_04120, partial [Campylobacterales bacterium]|nr:hypothetical protein [Campylobacterales bacterium]
MKKLFALVILCFLSLNVAFAATSLPKNFSLVYSKNQKGDIKVIGNSALCKSSKQSPLTYLNGSCQAPGTSEDNNDFYAIYSDIDSNSATSGSTSAKLNLNSGATISWAGLYWQGRLNSGNSETTNKNAAKQVKLKLPGALNYATVTADRLNYIYDSYGFAYQGFKDITSLINKNSPNGDYYLADIATQLGKNAYGAWSIVIVYSDATVSLKNISVYDGYVGLYKTKDEANGIYKNITIPLSGFLTPLSGAVNSKFLVFAGEGDVTLGGEKVEISNKSGTFYELTNAANQSGKQFNSNITDNGVVITGGMRNPEYANAAGIDIDTYDVSSIMQNGQNNTNIRLTGGDDRYYPGVFAFSTQMY